MSSKDNSVIDGASSPLLRVSDFCRASPKKKRAATVAANRTATSNGDAADSEQNRLQVRVVVAAAAVSATRNSNRRRSCRHNATKNNAVEKDSDNDADRSSCCCCCWVSERFLRRASIIAGKQLIWIINGERRVAVRTRLKQEEETTTTTTTVDESQYNNNNNNSEFDTLEISIVTAANLGLCTDPLESLSSSLDSKTTTKKLFDSFNKCHVEVYTGEVPTAKKVTVRYWGRRRYRSSIPSPQQQRSKPAMAERGGGNGDDGSSTRSNNNNNNIGDYDVKGLYYPAWPKSGSLLQPFSLVVTHRCDHGSSSSSSSSNDTLFFLEVVEVNAGDDDKDNNHASATPASPIYQSTSMTAYRIETLPAMSICPALPCLTMTRQLLLLSSDGEQQHSPSSLLPAAVCHPDVPKLAQTLHSAAATMSSNSNERILHVLGTDDEHHLITAMSAAADILGRQIVIVRGLAAYAYESGCQVGSGSLQDKLTGLHVALQQAQYSAPALLLIMDLDKELSQHDERLRQDEESRIWSLLTEELMSKADNNNNSNGHVLPLETALPVTPSIVVVLSSRQELRPGPILRHLTFESIPLSVPDQAYAEYLWAAETCGIGAVQDAPPPPPVVEGYASLVQGRTAGEIVALLQDYHDALVENNGANKRIKDTGEHCRTTLLKELCAQQDKNRRKKSGVAKIPSVHWQDVGGLEHVRREIMEAIEYPLYYPHLFVNGGGGAGRGVLLYGPPGSGKTLVAKAVATESQIPFLSVKGPELLGSYVGESEAQVREVFHRARQLAVQNQPAASVLFFDELDSLAPRRGDNASGGNVMDRVVATLFAELDKQACDDCTIFCIGATNRPDLLDPALLRPGRLDRLVYLGVPTRSDQSKILAAQIRKLRLDGEFDVRDMATTVADHLPTNITGADISTICTGGLLRATQRLCHEADEELRCLQANSEELVTLDKVLSSWTEDKLEPVVTLEDFLEAAKEVVPSVSQTELAKYEGLREQFKSS